MIELPELRLIDNGKVTLYPLTPDTLLKYPEDEDDPDEDTPTALETRACDIELPE
jgi:hypothetical protein